MEQIRSQVYATEKIGTRLWVDFRAAALPNSSQRSESGTNYKNMVTHFMLMREVKQAYVERLENELSRWSGVIKK